MAGLYDGIDPQTALLLGLGSGLLGTTGNGRRASFGEALANGMQAGTQGYRQAIGDRQRAEQIAAEQAAREQQMMLAREQMLLAKANAERDAKLFPGQLQAQKLGNDRSQAELDAQLASQRQAAEMRALLANLAGGGGGTMNAGPTLEGPPEPVGLPGGGSSSPEAYKAQIIHLVQSGKMPAAQGKALIEAGDFGRAEVKRSVDVQLKDGRPATQQLDIYGRPVGEAIPKAYERRFQDFGGTIGGLDPYTGQPIGAAMPKSMTPGEVASNAVARGNLGVAQANLGLSRQRLEFEKQGKPEFRDGVWQYPPTAANPNGAMVVPPGMAPPKGSIAADQRNASTVLQLIKEAEALIPKSTGSYLGTGVDLIGRAVGRSTDGALAGSQLQALQAALMLKMPRMEGPQSDRDVQLYRQAVGQIGDTTTPVDQRMAALQMVKRMQELYGGQVPATTISPNGREASGGIKPAVPTGPGTLIRFDANGNMIGN